MYNFKQYIKDDTNILAVTAVVLFCFVVVLASNTLIGSLIFGATLLLLIIGTIVDYLKAKKYNDNLNKTNAGN